jgi:hypothetical protein
MFGSFSKGAAAAPALARIHEWTRERFRLEAADTILVTELACTLQGCPPLETVVAYWTADGQRHHFKIFKRADQVLSDDLPYAWMKRALAVPEGFSDDCC